MQYLRQMLKRGTLDFLKIQGIFISNLIQQRYQAVKLGTIMRLALFLRLDIEPSWRLTLRCVIV